MPYVKITGCYDPEDDDPTLFELEEIASWDDGDVVRVGGYLEIEDHEYDPNHPMRVTTAAYEHYMHVLSELDDVEFGPDDRKDR